MAFETDESILNSEVSWYSDCQCTLQQCVVMHLYPLFCCLGDEAVD